MKRSLLSLAAATWLLADGSALAAQRERPRPPVVEEIAFEGVRALSPDTLRAVIATRPPRCRSALLAPVCALADWRWAEQSLRLDTLALRRDEAAVRALYAARGYPSAQVRARVIDLGEERARVRFDVAEGRPQVVRSVAVRGVAEAAIPPEVTLPPLPLRPGVPYSAARLQEAQRRIVSRLAEAGYPFAEVEVGGVVADDSADVVLEIDPGPVGVFGGAEIEAERPLRPEDIRRRLAFRPGQRFDPMALQRTVERLYDLPLVESVAVAPAPGPGGDSVVVPRITVEARRARGVQADFSFGSADCLGGVARWADRHFLGDPRVVSLSVGASNLFADALSESLCSGTAPGEFADPNYLVRLDWREPLAPDSWLTGMVAFERMAMARAYVRRGVRGRVALAHDFGRGWRGDFGYAPEWSDLGAVRPLYCVLLGSCSGPLPGELDGTTLLAPVEISAAWAPREARRAGLGPLEVPSWMLPLAPRWLYSAQASLAGAGDPTLSEFAFARATAEGAVTRLLGRRTEVAAHLRLGLLADGSGPAPPQVRLYGGGPLGVRGVSPNLLGPEYLLFRGSAEALPCAVLTGACEGLELSDDELVRRPLGGELLAEASLEGRLWATRWLQLAVFVDAGGITAEADLAPSGVETAEWLVAPGVGALLLSPFGPLRVDLAYNPETERRYPLVARAPVGDGHVYLGRVAVGREDGRWAEFRRRLRVQLYMGLPF